VAVAYLRACSVEGRLLLRSLYSGICAFSSMKRVSSVIGIDRSLYIDDDDNDGDDDDGDEVVEVVAVRRVVVDEGVLEALRRNERDR
jgi:hypothetical protein